MNKKSQIIPEKIHLLNLKVWENGYQVTDEFKNLGKKFNSFVFEIGTGLFKFNLEQKQVFFQLNIKIIGEAGDQNTEMGKAACTVDFIYNVENLEEFLHQHKSGNKKQTNVNKALGATIAAISYSTARGIIYQSFANSPFNGAILPIVEPASLLQNKKT